MPFNQISGRTQWKRLEILRLITMALIRHERIETSVLKALETQKYMERLVHVARYGQEDPYSRDMVGWWTNEEEELKKKLLEVLLPRFSGHAKNFTRFALMPAEKNYLEKSMRMAVLELKGNPLPPLPTKGANPLSLQNVIIAAAKKDWFDNKNRLAAAASK